MSKIYKSWKLIQAIADGEIKKGTKFKDKDKKEVEWDGNNFVFIDSGRDYTSVLSDIYFINEEFELIEDEIDIDNIEDEIDIDNIEELKSVTNNIDGTICMMCKINELVQAVKQIDKRVKKLEGK